MSTDADIKFSAGELCTEWRSWAQILNVRYLFASSLIQAATYTLTAVCLLLLCIEHYSYHI